MILMVFSHIGAKISITEAYASLVTLYSRELYPKHKAAGSLGGAVNRGTIILRDGYYERIR